MDAFTLTRTPVVNGARAATVVAIEDLTPTYRRIRLGGDFAGFQSLGADDHLRIFFVPAGFEAPAPGSPPEAFAAMREHPSREYTPVAWTDETLDLDFVIHGSGPASTWAQEAVVGTPAMIGGPRGSLVIDGRPDWWLLAGDRTALPAIRRFLGQVDPGVPADVILIAEDPADEQTLASAGELTVTWVHSLAALIETVGFAPQREGDGFAFVAAEQSIVKLARDLLVVRGVELDRAVVKGYWKRGEAEYHAPHAG